MIPDAVGSPDVGAATVLVIMAEFAAYCGMLLAAAGLAIWLVRRVLGRIKP